MSNVRDTSRNVYEDIKNEGLPDTQQEMILLAMYHASQPMTNREIAHAVELEPGTVSARRSELFELGTIQEHPKRKCDLSDRMALTWSLTRAGEWAVTIIRNRNKRSQGVRIC